MNLQDLFEQDTDEGWKSTVAGLGLAAVAGTGMHQYASQPVSSASKTTAPVAQAQTPQALLKQAAESAGLQGTELAQFMAQCAHETANFTRIGEIGTEKYFTKKYENPRAKKILGNTQAGDGARFKGRGYIQLTGRDNYTRAGKSLNIPLAQYPDLAARPDVASKVAVWYWKNRVATKVSDFSNTKATSHAINPRGQHTDRRQVKFQQYSQDTGI